MANVRCPLDWSLRVTAVVVVVELLQLVVVDGQGSRFAVTDSASVTSRCHDAFRTPKTSSVSVSVYVLKERERERDVQSHVTRIVLYS